MLKFESWPPEVGKVHFSANVRNYLDRYEVYDETNKYEIREIGRRCGQIIAANVCEEASINIMNDLSAQISEPEAAGMFENNFGLGILSEGVASERRIRA